MNCKKHTWQPLLPPLNVIKIQDSAGYWVAGFVLRKMGDMFYCEGCCKTGHKIKSHRSGIRVHTSDYFLIKANEVRKEFGLPLLNRPEGAQESDTTKAQSMDEPLLPNNRQQTLKSAKNLKP